MCMTSAALAAFLTIIGPEYVTLGEDALTIHAETADAVWVANGDRWCTKAPQLDRAVRFKEQDL